MRTLISRNDYSVRKRMTIGIGGFLTVATVSGYAGYRYMRKPKVDDVIPPPLKEEETLQPPETQVTIEKDTTEDEAYLPWWTGVKEISLYINDENAKEIEKEFPSQFDVT